MSEQPAITVVIPTGAVDGHLRTQLDAVLAQAGTEPFEVVVSLNTADAAARRALAQMIDECADPRLGWIDSSEIAGAAHARNAGAKAARGRVLAFCDSDDVVHPGWLRALCAAVDGPTARFDAVSGLCVDFTEDGDLPKWLPPPPVDELPTFMGRPYLLSGNLAVHRRVFDEIGGFDESLTRCEDIDLSWRLTSSGARLGFEPSAVLDYRIRPSVGKMLKQHYFYGIGQTEVLMRHGRDGAGPTAGASVLRPNNSKGGLRSPVAVLRKVAIAIGRLAGLWRLRRRRRAAGADR